MEVVTDKSVIITLAIPVFFLLIIVEYIYGRMIGKNTYRLNDTVTSITIGMISRFPTMLKFRGPKRNIRIYKLIFKLRIIIGQKSFYMDSRISFI